MQPWLQDADVTLYHGDVLTVLRELPAESVDCCVTSPPYWGLRDYGTGAWEGGDGACDHRQLVGGNRNQGRDRAASGGTFHDSPNIAPALGIPYADTCGKCGATRIDQQLGLEPTPEQYVTRMVEVFREVRRVLAAYGTVWLNLGDSYYTNGTGERSLSGSKPVGATNAGGYTGYRTRAVMGGLKPKDLVGIPWRVAFALQADGWYLRSDIIWAKPNPMPESVTDRPTKAHEYVFLLSKQPRYFFDQEAVREPWGEGTAERYAAGYNALWKRAQEASVTDSRDQGFRGSPEQLLGRAKGPDGRRKTTVQGADGSIQHRDGERWPNGGRNIRSVWEIATQPYPEAHFATFPEELARRCVAAGCPEQVCRVCGKARERIVETNNPSLHAADDKTLGWANMHSKTSNAQSSKSLHRNPGGVYSSAVVKGWTDCGHGDYRTGLTVDPFMGSGTVAHVARKLGRHAVGIDLNESYLELAARRLQQQSLFAEMPV